MESSWARQDNTSSVAGTWQLPSPLFFLLFDISQFHFPIHERLLIFPGTL